MSYYQLHLFFCCNQRKDGRKSCGQADAHTFYEYTKKKLKKLGLVGEGKIRISQSGCLGRCDLGPVMVIYPEGTWYTYADEKDIDEIIDCHILNHKKVDRLLIDPQQ